jgi:hypothetical protein
MNQASFAEATVPIGLLDGRDRETLRRPPHLDRAEIVRRLAQIRDFGPLDTGTVFVNVERMSSAQVGCSVIAALDWLQDHPGNDSVCEQLQIVAVNLNRAAWCPSLRRGARCSPAASCAPRRSRGCRSSTRFSIQWR